MGLSYTAPPLKRNTVPVFVNDKRQDGASSVHCVDDLDSVALRLLDLVLLDSQQALPLLISRVGSSVLCWHSFWPITATRRGDCCSCVLTAWL